MELVVVKSPEPLTGDKTQEVQVLWSSHISSELHQDWQVVRVNERRPF